MVLYYPRESVMEEGEGSFSALKPRNGESKRQ